MLHALFILDINDNLLSLVRRNKLIDPPYLLLVRILLFLHLALLLLKLEQLHLKIVLILTFPLELHGLIPESFFKIGKVVHVPLLTAHLTVGSPSRTDTQLLLLL